MAFSTRTTLFDAPPPRSPLVRRERHAAGCRVDVGGPSGMPVGERVGAGVPGASLARSAAGPGFRASRAKDERRLQAGCAVVPLRRRGGVLDPVLPAERPDHPRVRAAATLESLRAAGFNVFAFDYRGFGRNSGIPSEAGLYEDALTAYRHLTEELGVAPSRIILSGRSLDPPWRLISPRVPSGGMLLLSAIDSVPARAARLYPWAPVTWLASLQFDSLAKAPRIQIPVLQVHAPEDWLVPLETARALFARFPGRKVMLELPGGHNDVGFRDESLNRTLAQFWSNPR